MAGQDWVMRQPVIKIITKPESCITMLLEKLQLSKQIAISIWNIFQGSAMAATGEWRDDLYCSKLMCISLDRAVR